MKVGIFDSGIGGLSVLHHAQKVMPQTDFIYYADEEHVPYGEKTEEQIKGYVREILNFLVAQEVEAIVIACNTATSVATPEFRKSFPVPIVGIEPAVKKAVEMYRGSHQRILVAATPLTIAGDKLHHLLEQVDTEHETDLLPLPMLVRFAEQGDFHTPKIDAYLRQELGRLHLEEYAALVLGCTHFNYFKEHFQRIFPGPIHFVDGNAGTIRQLMRVVYGAQEQLDTAKKTGSVRFYISGKPADEAEQKRFENYMKRLEQVYRLE